MSNCDDLKEKILQDQIKSEQKSLALERKYLISKIRKGIERRTRPKEIFQNRYTKSGLADTLKKELAKVTLNIQEYLKQIEKHKVNRPSNQYFYDYNLGLDFSIDTNDSTSIERKIYDDRKYYYHAYHYLKLGLFKREDVPYFWIDLSDLSPDVIYELNTLEKNDRNFVLKQAVGRILEDIHFDTYHNSVSSSLKVRLR